jgi:membrane-associated protease RseP (regulator of RpoE activity)
VRSLSLAVLVLSSTVAFAKTSNPAFLGVQMNDLGRAASGASIGPCMISEITRDSSAEAAGLQRNDVFVSLDGASVASCDDLVAKIQTRVPGDTIKLVVTRDGRDIKIDARLMSRDEVLRKRFGGLPVPRTSLVRVDDRAEVDLSVLRRQTTIVGWYPTSCTGCDLIFAEVAKWTREQKSLPSKVAAATAGDLRMVRPMKETLEYLKTEAHRLDVPLLASDPETYKEFTISDNDRVQFMVIDCRGIVQYAAPIVPGSEDNEAVLDELYAAAEQAARRMK